MSETLFKLRDDLKLALKAREEERVGFLRFLLSHVHNKEIEKRGKGVTEEVTEDDVLDVLRKEMKRKKEAIRLFSEGKRDDLAEKETKELEWLTFYLPPLPTKGDIERIAHELKEKGIHDFSTFMKEAMIRLPGADGAEVSAAFKKVL